MLKVSLWPDWALPNEDKCLEANKAKHIIEYTDKDGNAVQKEWHGEVVLENLHVDLGETVDVKVHFDWTTPHAKRDFAVETLGWQAAVIVNVDDKETGTEMGTEHMGEYKEAYGGGDYDWEHYGEVEQDNVAAVSEGDAQ